MNYSLFKAPSKGFYEGQIEIIDERIFSDRIKAINLKENGYELCGYIESDLDPITLKAAFRSDADKEIDKLKSVKHTDCTASVCAKPTKTTVITIKEYED